MMTATDVTDDGHSLLLHHMCEARARRRQDRLLGREVPNPIRKNWPGSCSDRAEEFKRQFDEIRKATCILSLPWPA
eukprot:7863841-Pyramimonas_sp.AAC.1